jgi:adenylate cyclase
VAEKQVQRRLAAILAADVAGYSRLMGADEEDTLERLKAHRRLMIDPKIGEHRGRIVKTTGDGVLAEFPSVVDAVRCAAELQRAMVERNADVSEDRRIAFRIGVNLGDIIVDDDDIFGDGVNIAARLEALAEPGGICVSRTVRNQVRDKLPYSFEDMGEQSVKNIARPVRADAMGAEAVAATPLVAVAAIPPEPPRRITPRHAIIAAGLVAAIGVGLGAFWIWPHGASPPEPANPQTPAAVSTAAKPAPRLSIVVLPFANLSNDPDQEYFADGITDDLTTDLSRISDSFVIARTTAFTYKGKPVDAKQIGRDLGVRYVLEGSVRRSGDQVQLNVQLIDAESGAHIWAERYDTDRANLVRTQSEVTARLARTLQLQLVEAVGRRIEQDKPENLDARDLIMHAWAYYNRPRSAATLDEAQRLFEQALAIDPGSVDARVGVAWIVDERVAQNWSKSRAADMARAEELLRDALERDQNDVKARAELGRLRRLQGRLPESLVELERAIALDRNSMIAIAQCGITNLFLGRPEAALPYFEKWLRLDPQSQNVFFVYYWLGYAHLLLSQTTEAIEFSMKARSANPNIPSHHLLLAAALGLKGDIDAAKPSLAEWLKRKPEGKSIADLRTLAASFPYMSHPQFVALQETTVLAGLRRAGLPEE